MVDINKLQKQSFWSLAWPVCLEGLFLTLISSVDLMMVSHLGVEATSAVGVFSQLKMVILCFARSLSVAVTAQISFLYGQQDFEDISSSMKKSITVVVLIGGIICTVTYLWIEPILYFSGAQESYIQLAISYAKPMILSIFFTSISTVIHGGLLACGRTIVMMFANIAGNILNIVLNAILVNGIGYFPKMGISGAAWGTVHGALLTLLITFWVVFSTNGFLHIRGKKHWLPNYTYMKQLLGKFVGIFTEQSAERIGMFLYSYLSAGLGVLPFAVHTICMNLCDLYYCFAQGLGKSSLTLSGFYCGKKSSDLKYLIRTAYKTTWILSCIACIGYIIFGESLFLLYQADDDVIQLGKVVLIFVAFVSFPEAQALVCAGILRGLGYTSLVAKYFLISVAIIRPIITWILCYYLKIGLFGAWIALMIDQLTRAFCATYYVKKIQKDFSAY